MNKAEIMSKVDLTILRADTSRNEIVEIIENGINAGVHSICVPHYFMFFARHYIDLYAEDKGLPKPKLCTVVAFPLGNLIPSAKQEEAAIAIQHGADEIDMVINISMLKERSTKLLVSEINDIKRVCGNRTLKVIIETALLSKEDKIYACEIISQSNADYLKTSTGFAKGGATIDDIRLIRQHLDSTKKIKASGGIKTLAFAAELINAGADRIGTSTLF